MQEREYKFYFLGLVDCCLHLQLNIRGFNFSMEQEIWKTIIGFDGYEVSNNGDVRSKKRLITIHRKSCTYTRTQPVTILTPYADKDGYLTVTLYDNKTHKGVHFRVSRLVASAFIPNPKNLPQVNHKDQNVKNNCVDNLEWCDAKYNTTYNFAHIKRGLKRRNNKQQSKPVIQTTKENVFINFYPSIIEAERQTKINKSHINQCCLNHHPYYSAGGYKWRFATNEEIKRYGT